MKWKDVNELCAKTVQDVQDGWRVSKHFRVYVTNDGFFGLWVVRCTSSIHQRMMEPHFFYIETKMWFLNIFQCLKVGILFGSANLYMILRTAAKSIAFEWRAASGPLVASPHAAAPASPRRPAGGWLSGQDYWIEFSTSAPQCLVSASKWTD